MRKSDRGFELIETLVIIALIGLLSTLAVVAMHNARMNSYCYEHGISAENCSEEYETYLNNL